MSLFFGFFTWWYTEGYKKIYTFLRAAFHNLNNIFSVKVVLRTFFEPWRRLVGERRKGLEGFRDWLLDNLVSRLVGVVMRSVLLFIYAVTALFYLTFSFTSLVFWGFFPALFVVALVQLFGGLNG